MEKSNKKQDTKIKYICKKDSTSDLRVARAFDILFTETLKMRHLRNLKNKKY